MPRKLILLFTSDLYEHDFTCRANEKVSFTKQTRVSQRRQANAKASFTEQIFWSLVSDPKRFMRRG